MSTAHLILQSKGGVGKSLAAFLLAQSLPDKSAVRSSLPVTSQWLSRLITMAVMPPRLEIEFFNRNDFQLFSTRI